jgi:hypothetical protein
MDKVQNKELEFGSQRCRVLLTAMSGLAVACVKTSVLSLL